MILFSIGAIHTRQEWGVAVGEPGEEDGSSVFKYEMRIKQASVEFP